MAIPQSIWSTSLEHKCDTSKLSDAEKGERVQREIFLHGELMFSNGYRFETASVIEINE